MKNTDSMCRLRPLMVAAGLCADLLLSIDSTSSAGAPSPTIRLASKGAANARIVLPSDPSDRVREAGTLLADYLKRSTGAELAVVEEGTSARRDGRLVSIHVGLHITAPRPGCPSVTRTE